MATTKVLQLTFINDQNKKKTITLANAAGDLNGEEVKAAMSTISQANVFEKDGVVLYRTPDSAKYIERTVTTLFENNEAA
ncbi:hypothetical protein J2Z60_000584 [Lactobacillus colini]|uniref:DUF2922 domain-containing protein n=1 Tax=Lactobacillus colini TaxID=1819254 RepID=A0ABS4MCL1_9LACO|nr:hypothetical protein [Lactobacillus colini]